MVRNKEWGAPEKEEHHIGGLPRARARYASKRADGTIQTRPQERMLKSNQREQVEE